MPVLGRHNVSGRVKLLTLTTHGKIYESVTVIKRLIMKSKELLADGLVAIESEQLIDNALSLTPVIREPLTEFHFFPKLPSEIRLKIWNLSLPCPRLIRLAVKLFFCPPRSKYILVIGTTSPTPEICMLKACWESRKLTLEKYPTLIPIEPELRLCASDMLIIEDIPALLHSICKVIGLPDFEAPVELRNIQDLGILRKNFQNPVDLDIKIHDLTYKVDCLMKLLPNLKSVKLVCGEETITEGGSLDGLVTDSLNMPAILAWRKKRDDV